ncbi:MAG: hypothetical protein L6Q46_13515 [Flavobacterium sp.]|uniref:hypothetical protein n=1 Tax=Flavobacterium sp. TaxID=239 RepID=UPI0025C0A8EF|nr:hypothetical protein [Flavobacterium sp.]MCK6609298.1 hypothetical protein [Flavobacterium sp.]
MGKIKLFNEGDVILTNPAEGFWGIAVVLSEREKTENYHPMCHIAITPIIRNHKIEFSELKIEELKPLEFERVYALKNVEDFSKNEICIGVYTRRNKENIEIIGSINPKIVYDGPLPFDPWSDLEIKWPLCGEPTKSLGREAYITWKKHKTETEN